MPLASPSTNTCLLICYCVPATPSYTRSGLWRGTGVAIKTIVLPANMSGKEKREKMAVMEAAISSSLAHPNIVQVRVGAWVSGVCIGHSST